jgi:hypothetical protein
MRLQSTIAVSKFAGEGILRVFTSAETQTPLHVPLQDYSALERSLAAISKIGQAEYLSFSL